MVRLQFTSADIGRVRFALPGPLAESQLSFWTIQRGGEAALFDRWRVRARLGLATGDLPALVRGLAAAGKGMVDLFTLVGTVPETENAIDTLLCDPQPLRAELALYSPRRQALIPEWVFGAADGEGLAARRLAAALAAAYQATVAPHWTRMHAVLKAEMAAAASAMITGGAGVMLASLHPAIRWEPPVLEFPYRSWGPHHDIHLEGRGLVITPSIFGRQPLLYAAGSGELMLIYPVLRNVLGAAEVFGTSRRGSDAVAHLLGRTRTAVLEATDGGATTSQIASSLEISPASASQHSAVLREAGLVSSRRHGKAVRHSLTPLGKALLDGSS